MSKAKLIDLVAEKEKIQKAVFEAMISTYPLGATVCFEKWGGVIEGRVINHRGIYGDPRLKIRNIKTQKEYWINLVYILRY